MLRCVLRMYCIDVSPLLESIYSVILLDFDGSMELLSLVGLDCFCLTVCLEQKADEHFILALHNSRSWCQILEIE